MDKGIIPPNGQASYCKVTFVWGSDVPPAVKTVMFDGNLGIGTCM